MEIFIIVWFMLVGMGVDTEYGPGVINPVECVGVACSADHDNRPASKPDTPDAPDPTPDPAPEPDEPASKPDEDHDKGHGNSDGYDPDNPGKGPK